MILKHEILKIAKMPIIWVLLIFFLGLNILLCMSNTDYKEDMTILKGLVASYGHEINEEMLSDLEADYQKKINWVNSISKNERKIYNHPSGFLKENKTDGPLSKDEAERLWSNSTIEDYYRTSKAIDEIYEGLNLSASANTMVAMYGMEDAAANTVRTQFQKLDERLDELIDNGEHKHLFFNNLVYEMHELLFEKIGHALIFELMVLVVLITAAITNYEFENKTSAISYTTKRGRKLVIHKLVTAIISTFVVTSVLIGLTLTTYFITYDYSGLWNVPISAYFNAEMPLPYISWWNLSFLQYLGFFVFFVFVSQYLFMGMTFILSVFIKNTYLVFFLFLLLLGLGILIPGLVPSDSNLIFYANYNPFVFILNPHEWLMGNGPFTIYKNYEALTIGIWSVLICILSALCIEHFKRQQLY